MLSHFSHDYIYNFTPGDSSAVWLLYYLSRDLDTQDSSVDSTAEMTSPHLEGNHEMRFQMCRAVVRLFGS